VRITIKERGGEIGTLYFNKRKSGNIILKNSILGGLKCERYFS
jgi:hypothetical protein